MEKYRVLSDSAGATAALGEAVGSRLTGGEVILLSGPLGAGKTTLTQGIARGLGVTRRVQSPSFVLERVHRGRLTLRHLDFYRLTPEEVDDAGFFSEQDESTVTVVEWAERAEEIPAADLRIDVEYVPGRQESRAISLRAMSPEWREKLQDVQRQHD